MSSKSNNCHLGAAGEVKVSSWRRPDQSRKARKSRKSRNPELKLKLSIHTYIYIYIERERDMYIYIFICVLVRIDLAHDTYNVKVGNESKQNNKIHQRIQHKAIYCYE